MREHWRVVGVLAGLLALGTVSAAAQEVHEIRMVSTGKGEFRYVPASVSARGGDVLLFRAVSGAPHSVVFEDRNLTAQDRQRLNAALARRSSDHSSPLLTEGAEYRFVVPPLTAGTYRFFCLPHRAYDMRGELTVK
jgi:plastocyanin